VRGTRGGEPISVGARLVVGDDGPRSRVREGLGIALPTTNFAVDFLSAAGPALPGLPSNAGEAWVDPWAVRRGLFAVLFLPLPQARTAMVFLLSPAAYRRFAAANPSEFYLAAERLSPRAADLAAVHKFPEGLFHITRPFGHAQRYVADGAALLGDAAHPVTPAGGQGANMSVSDASVLIEVADAALARGDCGAGSLRPYELIRRPANERSLRFSARTHRVLRALEFAPWLSPLLPIGLRAVDRRPALRQRFIRSVAQAFRSDRSVSGMGNQETQDAVAGGNGAGARDRDSGRG
jgi:2-polyprenyl-6-methoxyphenol hydroxylase-like FAD-dependent oxidoreductase